MIMMDLQTTSKKETFYGKTKIDDKIIQDLTIHGLATLSGITILNNLNINGTLFFTNLKINNIGRIDGNIKGEDGTIKIFYVTGTLKMSNVNIEQLSLMGIAKIKNSKINLGIMVGTIKILDSEFTTLQLKPKKMTIQNCQINTIEINNDKGRVKDISISGGTTIQKLIIYGIKLEIVISDPLVKIINYQNVELKMAQ
jgi:hypothetical protein